jgi:hypothetical protein
MPTYNEEAAIIHLGSNRSLQGVESINHPMPGAREDTYLERLCGT